MKKFLSKLHNTKWEDINSTTVESAKFVLLDTIGAYIAGVNQPELKRMAVSFSEKGDYEVIHTGQQTSVSNVALIHGTAVVALEMDEGNQYSKGHPAAHVIPVLLTLMQEKDRTTGKEFLLDLIKGYEACSRFGRAATLHPDMHAHGTWGAVGAAATALLASRLPEIEVYEGVNLSASFVLPTSWCSALEGKLVRNVYTGHAIEAGIRSLKLTRAGYNAPEQNTEYVFSRLLGSEWDDRQLDRKQDEPWDIERNYFKQHAFCRYSHAPLDGFKRLVSKHSFSTDEIKVVNVFTYSRAATLSNQDYYNPLSAKFSIPYAIASWMYFGQSDHSIFSDTCLGDERLKKLAQKVFVLRDKKMDDNYPDVMPARVEIHLTSGKVITEALDGAKGGPESRLTHQEIVDKFKELTESYLAKEQAEEIIQFIFGLEQQDTVQNLQSLLRKKEPISL